MNLDKILDIIYESIDEVNDQFSTDYQMIKSRDTVLFGKSSQLDSLGLVNLIVAVEQMLADELDVHLTLADEKAMSQRNSPFRTVTSLAEYILSLLEENEE